MKNPCHQSLHLGEESTLVCDCTPSEENIDLTVTANSCFLNVDAMSITFRVLARTRKTCSDPLIFLQSDFLTLYCHHLGLGSGPRCSELLSIVVFQTDDLGSSFPSRKQPRQQETPYFLAVEDRSKLHDTVVKKLDQGFYISTSCIIVRLCISSVAFKFHDAYLTGG